MGNGVTEAGFNDFLGKQAQGPAVVTFGSIGTGKSSDLGALSAVDDNRAAGARRIMQAGEARALLFEDRLRVRAGYVELIAGTPLDDLEEVARNRQTWTSAAQARRTRYQHRQGTSEGTVGGHK